MSTRLLFAFVAAALIVLVAWQFERIRQQLEKLGPKWRNLHPELRRRLERVLVNLKAQGYDVGIPSTGGWREVAEQAGIPKANTQVKDPLNSSHAWGTGADLVPRDARGEFYWPPHTDPVWRAIRLAAQAEGLVSGSDWDGDGVPVDQDPDEDFFDGPHVQLPIPVWKVRKNFTAPADFIAATATDPGLPRLA